LEKLNIEIKEENILKIPAARRMSKVMSRQNYFQIHAATLFDAFHAAKFAPYDKTHISHV